MITKLPWKVLQYSCPKTKKTIKVDTSILSPKYTLVNGQAFNWHPLTIESSKGEDPQQVFHGVLRNYYVQFKTDSEGLVNYRALPEDDNLEEYFYEYFQFQYEYEDLISDWKKTDKLFDITVDTFKGLRIVRQDPFECLIEFICSQNNNIPRITKLIYSLGEKYGDFIQEIDGKKYYKFPTLKQLSATTEGTLREMGFGYRANLELIIIELNQVWVQFTVFMWRSSLKFFKKVYNKLLCQKQFI